MLEPSVGLPSVNSESVSSESVSSEQIHNESLSSIDKVFSAEQRASLLLWQRVNASLIAYYKLLEYFATAEDALASTPSKWQELGIHKKHIERHSQASRDSDTVFIETVQRQIKANEFDIVFQNEAQYPQQLLAIFDPPPLLFYRGNLQRLNQHQIAIVGSRKPTQKAQKFTFDLAQYLAKVGFVITSGLAQGVDAQAHLGALSQSAQASGRTVGVMGTGIDVCYPSQHQPLFDRIINEGGCIISELFPGTPPHKHTFPRRNRLVAGLSIGTVVTEAAIKSGSLITARLTSEQGKQVFALPSSIDNQHAEGCHHLIREGATLIYHPDQIINDLSSQLLLPTGFAADAELEDENSTTNRTDKVEFTNHLKVEGTALEGKALEGRALEGIALEGKRIEGFTKSDKTDNDPKLAASLDSLFSKPHKDHKLDATVKGNRKTSSQRHATQSFSTQAKKENADQQKLIDISQHLQPLWVHIEFEPQDLDALIAKTKLDTATLLSQLMELELLGAVAQTGGRYKRL